MRIILHWLFLQLAVSHACIWGYGGLFGRLGYNFDPTDDLIDKETGSWYVHIPRLAERLYCTVLTDPFPSSIRRSQLLHFNNKEHSDVTFIVEDQPLYANIEILSRKSEYFEAPFLKMLSNLWNDDLTVLLIREKVFRESLD